MTIVTRLNNNDNADKAINALDKPPERAGATPKLAAGAIAGATGAGAGADGAGDADASTGFTPVVDDALGFTPAPAGLPNPLPNGLAPLPPPNMLF